MNLRDMTEADIDVLFDIQDDELGQHMAAFTSPDGDQRDTYAAKWRRILADDQTTTKVIEVDGDVVGSVGSFVLDDRTEVTYWIRRDSWGRGIATAALAELLGTLGVRPVWARVAADNVASATVLERNGFRRVGEDVGFARARGTEIREFVYRLDAPSDPVRTVGGER